MYATSLEQNIQFHIISKCIHVSHLHLNPPKSQLPLALGVAQPSSPLAVVANDKRRGFKGRATSIVSPLGSWRICRAPLGSRGFASFMFFVLLFFGAVITVYKWDITTIQGNDSLWEKSGTQHKMHEQNQNHFHKTITNKQSSTSSSSSSLAMKAKHSSYILLLTSEVWACVKYVPKQFIP